MAKESLVANLERFVSMGKNLFTEKSSVTVKTFNQVKLALQEEISQLKEEVERLEDLLYKSEEIIADLDTQNEAFISDVAKLGELIPQFKFKLILPQEEVTVTACLRCGFENERGACQCVECGFVFPYAQAQGSSDSFYVTDETPPAEIMQRIPFDQSRTYLKLKEMTDAVSDGTVDINYYRESLDKAITVITKTLEALELNVVKQKITQLAADEVEIIEKAKKRFFAFTEALREMALYVEDEDPAHAIAGFAKASKIMEELDEIQDMALNIAVEKGVTVSAK